MLNKEIPLSGRNWDKAAEQYARYGCNGRFFRNAECNAGIAVTLTVSDVEVDAK